MKEKLISPKKLYLILNWKQDYTLHSRIFILKKVFLYCLLIHFFLETFLTFTSTSHIFYIFSRTFIFYILSFYLLIFQNNETDYERKIELQYMLNEEMFDGSALLSLEFLHLRGFLVIFDDKCVYSKRENRTLNLVLSALFLILTLLASFLRAFRRKSWKITI